jgi:DNA gyrase/topoisomerase IV subunit A
MAMSALEQLRAIKEALSDPRRLVNAVSGTDDDAEAIQVLRREFNFTELQARVVLDQQFRFLTRKGLAAIGADIARREAEAARLSDRGEER